MTTKQELNDSFNSMARVALKLKRDRDALLSACKGALACLASGDLTPEMALVRLRNAIEQAESDTPCLDRVRKCGKCHARIELHHKWYFKFVGNAVQMRHRQCEFPTHYLTFEQYAKQYGRKLAKTMYAGLLLCLFASPCLALPDSPVPKVVALPVVYARVASMPRPVVRESWFQRPSTLAAFQAGSVAFDIATTKRFESRGYVETGPYRFITGPRPTVRCMAIGGAAEVGVSYLLARRFPKLRWLQVGFTAAHTGAGFHNLTLK